MYIFIFYIFYFFGGSGTWTQGLHREPLHQPVFVTGIFEIESHELFAWAGFEPWSSWSASLVARITGVSHRCVANFLYFYLQEVFFFLLAVILSTCDKTPWDIALEWIGNLKYFLRKILKFLPKFIFDEFLLIIRLMLGIVLGQFN
jgi:hypothetical protein